MQIQFSLSDYTLYIYLSGDMDEHSSSVIRRSVDRIIDEATSASEAVFNLSGVNFMDSTGIGFLIGRYKRLKKYGMKMKIEGTSLSTDKVLSLSGVYSLIQKV